MIAYLIDVFTRPIAGAEGALMALEPFTIIALVMGGISLIGVGVSLQQANKMAKSMSQKPPEFDSVKVPVAEDGREIPVIFGTVDLMGPNVTWYNKIDFVPIKSKSGKK